MDQEHGRRATIGGADSSRITEDPTPFTRGQPCCSRGFAAEKEEVAL
jgi:hypothetical protein